VKDEHGKEIPASVANWESNLRANRQATPVTLPLSGREAMVARLYADDHSAEEVGIALGLSTETVKSYLRRVRLKYENDGRTADNKLRLRACLVADGLLVD
jgi:two-component system uhpT operon response regulator UhpA